MKWIAALCWWRPPCILRSVIVNFVDDQEMAVRGVLWSSRGSWLTLKQAEMLRAKAQPSPLDGDFVVHRDRVLFIQVLPS